MSDDIQYSDHFIERLHTVWGEGFLSPGGPEEVRQIVSGIDLSGKIVLDITLPALNLFIGDDW
jgi:hypothetical protein